MKNIFISLMMVLACHPVAAETAIDVFTYAPGSVLSIPNTQIYIHDLSRTAAIEATAPEFPYDPANPAPTIAASKAWMQSEDGRRWHGALRESYKPMEKLYQCGIRKVPAIAFGNCRYVIYGLSDVKQAVQEYDEFIRKNGVTK